ncbi:GNAT family N-acetyltransferase [Streptomyces agglomeratus]|uniref:GNAT family N-acetyltransferase n=1 Tax=Streptomyces agglomeratus TaxID=285458 RepID=UPI00086A2BF7|nr:GNAT family N-acetyltransferase [Streptomyces agglomeratus]OEJ63019.1 GNAT family N-acetyltransferase [Streptomyces agglomeratus]
MTWTVTPERYDPPESTALRRDYYGEVAGRYWGRPATAREIDEGLADDGVELLARPTGEFVVGRYGGTAAACAGLRVVDPGVAELTRVYVRPAFRGTGGGGLLLATAEAAARDLGVGRVRLDTRNDLVEARALYARHGYDEVPAFNQGPYAEHWFAKSL